MALGNTARSRLAAIEACVMVAVAVISTIGVMLAYVLTIGLLMFASDAIGMWSLAITIPLGLGAAVAMYLLMCKTMELGLTSPLRRMGLDLDPVWN